MSAAAVSLPQPAALQPPQDGQRSAGVDFISDQNMEDATKCLSPGLGREKNAPGAALAGVLVDSLAALSSSQYRSGSPFLHLPHRRGFERHSV